ncbi:EamA family transporter [Oceaniglobus trochenteri]|uniref:EamA family transporter n=1 Tax=Oceaniglobus trochenteri TaxID=2763260 RepID=UPI001CFFC82E|nr:EamA family transporter [Oceaniglobus trochenteri]
MIRPLDILLTALAPCIWGSTYLVTTQMLPEGYPLTAATLRALPAGLLLLALTRTLPRGGWIWRSVVLGMFNFSIFWWLLFVAAYRLPGGVAATVGAVQPLIVLFLARLLLNQAVRPAAVIAGLGGLVGVALLVLGPRAAMDIPGIAAALGGAVSMAFGTVLTRRWQPPVSALTFTAWQLVAGGMLLLPAALLLEPPLPALTPAHVAGFAYLGLIGGAVTYVLWFRGIALLGPSRAAPLGLLSPVAAVLLGWAFLTQAPGAIQALGMAMVILSVWVGQRAQAAPTAPDAIPLPDRSAPRHP